ncbi:protein of unknown function DUF742 [Catenulispora acidiphila DSM 44928]|uniref:DUF742 domain-containing protein n=1 Tax=Catenulispora acidiphila (strain DSM 44928 / JCM 14897 / NBRC 102108 / NRRL B-24433 / ID139908) TaxID=479433 RepID=C7PXJ7_CATAD|nr:protein of unknown function DUF742 [Catenulispora acidiphila DSM 44928]
MQPSQSPRPRHAASDGGPASNPASADIPSPNAAPNSVPNTGPATGPTRAEARRNSEPPTPQRRDSRLERIYVITGGRSAPPAELDLVTLIVAADAAPPDLSPEQATMLRLCRRPLSVAELSAHLRLPFSATAVLVADLLAAGLVVQRRPVRAPGVDPELLKKVINGLRRL